MSTSTSTSTTHKTYPVALYGVAAEEFAYEFALREHGDQKDKTGAPYIEHLMAVADGAEWLQKEKIVPYVGSVSDIRVVGLLHDVLEDVWSMTPEKLRQERFSETVVKAVQALTKRPNEPQLEYMARVMYGGRLAMIVKLADLYHNTKYSRMTTLDKSTQVRLLTKYSRAVGILEAALVVEDKYRRAWWLRQQLAALEAAGYKSYTSTTTTTSTSTTTTSTSTTTSNAKWDYPETNEGYSATYQPGMTWDVRQQSYVLPMYFIGGAEWDGWYYNSEHVLTQARKDESGRYLVPPDNQIWNPRRKTSKVVAKFEEPVTTGTSQERVYTPSVDYYAQKAEAEKNAK